MIVYLLIALLIYAVVGIGFSLYFVTRGVARVDPTAHGAPVGLSHSDFSGIGRVVAGAAGQDAPGAARFGSAARR